MGHRRAPGSVVMLAKRRAEAPKDPGPLLVRFLFGEGVLLYRLQ
jgi:hypothetical protein